MCLKTILVCLLFCVLKTSAQVEQCPTTFPEECSCRNSDVGPYIDCITIPLETWNIKTSFDQISESINNNSAVMYEVMIDAAYLGQNQEVPPHSISTLKAEYLIIWAYHKFSRIDPIAFSGLHPSLRVLTIYQMEYANSSELFDLINNFKGLENLFMSVANIVSEIPANAFDGDLQSLSVVALNDANVESVGDSAFAAPPNLVSLYLDGNNLTLDGISPTAFDFASPEDVFISLERNPGITHLAQEKFQNFLGYNKNFLFVGPGTSGDPLNFLSCDERVDWICDTAITRVYGYYCKEQEYENIYDYCDQNFGFSPLDKINPKELQQIKLADRLRRDIIDIKQKETRRTAEAKIAARTQTQN